MSSYTIIHARYIIPIIPERVILENYSLIFHTSQGMIVDLLSQDEARKKYPEAQMIDRTEHILLPGFVNAHTHSPMSLLRGYADDVELMPWLQNHIWPAEQEWVSEEFVRDGTELAIAEMLRSGTTCFNDMYFYPDVTAKVTIQSGMRALIGAPVLMFPTKYASSPTEYLEKGMKLVKEFHNGDLVHISLSPHAPYTVSDQQIKDIYELAKKEKTQINMHVHETEQEVKDSIAQNGIRPIERLHRLGVLGPHFISVHNTQMNEEEIKIFREKKVSIVHCPESNTKLSSGFCPVHKLITNGVNVCLGTDGAASNNDLDMFGEMRTAALLGKLESRSAAACDAFTILKMATINGAKALGLEQKIGSLEKNKQADFITLKANQLEFLPLFNPISHIVYVMGRESVTDVWVAGKQLLHDKKLVTLDEQTIVHKVLRWQEKLRKFKENKKP